MDADSASCVVPAGGLLIIFSASFAAPARLLHLSLDAWLEASFDLLGEVAPVDNHRRARRGADAITSAHRGGYQACVHDAGSIAVGSLKMGMDYRTWF
jgi:hypothetical protein